MINSRLLQLIHHLTPSELNLVVENIINTKDNKDHHSLLLKCIINNKREKLTKEWVYSNVFDKRPYNDQQLRLVMSQLLKKIEDVIIDDQNNMQQDTRWLTLLTFYRRKGLHKHYQSVWRKWTSKKHEYKNAEYYQQLVDYEIENYEYASSIRRNQELNIQSSLDHMDLAYLSRKLRHACLALAHSAVYNVQYDMGIGSLIFDALEGSTWLNYPAIDMYYSCYKMLCDPDHALLFEKYRQDIKKYGDQFPPKEMRTLFLLGINICIRRLNQGKTDYGQIGLELYNECLAKKYLMIDGHLSRYTYRNIAMMAIRVGAFDWANTFTDTYKDELKKDEQHAAYHFNQALISYHADHLEEALDHIVEADFKDHLINLAAKTLQAKIYFQLNQIQLLDSHLESMEMYIIRNKVLGYHRANYKKLISYLKKITRLNPYDKNKKLALLDAIQKEDRLTEKDWFVQQLSEI